MERRRVRFVSLYLMHLIAGVRREMMRRNLLSPSFAGTRAGLLPAIDEACLPLGARRFDQLQAQVLVLARAPIDAEDQRVLATR